MSTLKVLMFWLVIRLAVVVALLLSCADKTRETLGVQAQDFGAATTSAMDLWNGWVGCDFLVAGDDIAVKSDDGEPCGAMWRPEAEWGHAATSYQCRRSDPRRFEILVSQPGDLHDQLCIIAHELGHILGRKHARRGVMSKECPTFVRVLDVDVRAARARFCR